MRSQENNIPVIAFSAWSGTGKTTVIEALIKNLKAKGLRVAAIKHDAHSFEIDRKGKDSYRFFEAGADISVISSSEKTAVIEQRGRELSDIVSTIDNVDIIFAEGFNNNNLPRVGISRLETGKGLRLPADDCIAVLSDDPSISIQTKTPVFALDDTEGLACFLLDRFGISLR